MRLTERQRRGLIELRAASDENIAYGGDGWVRTGGLCGSREERSAANMRSLIGLGLAEGHKPDGHNQTQWSWRITPAGRAALWQVADPPPKQGGR